MSTKKSCCHASMKLCLAAFAMTVFVMLGVNSTYADEPIQVRFEQMFLNHGSIMLLIDSATGDIVFSNLAAERFYGYARSKLESMNVNQINTMSESELAVERAAAAAEERNHFVFQHRLADGRVRIVEVTSYPYRVDDRSFLFSIVKDVTAREYLETGLILAVALIVGLLAMVIALLAKSGIRLKKTLAEEKSYRKKADESSRRNALLYNTISSRWNECISFPERMLGKLLELTSSEDGILVIYEAGRGLIKDYYVTTIKKVSPFDMSENSSAPDTGENGIGLFDSISKDIQEIQFFTDGESGAYPHIYNNMSQRADNEFDLPITADVESEFGDLLSELLRSKRHMAVPVYADRNRVALVLLAGKPEDYQNEDVYQVTTLLEGIWNLMLKQQSQNELLQEKEKYRSILMSIGDGVVVVDEDNRIVLLNGVATKMTGWNEDEARNRHIDEILRHETPSDFMLGEEDLPFLGYTSENTKSLYNIKTREDKSYFVEETTSKILDSNQKSAGRVIVLHDRTQSIAQQAELIFLHRRDPLTGLINRRFLEEIMLRMDAICTEPISVVMSDLDGLKITNDAFGHKAGDELLISASHILKNHCRREDILARWDGDEFVVILRNTGPDQLSNFVSKLQHSFRLAQTQDPKLSLSFGTAYKTDDNQALVKVLRLAEHDMHRKKLVNRRGFHGQLIETIMNTLFEKSPREQKHSERVRDLALSTARAHGLTQAEVDDVGLMALMHDIGKIIVPSHILDKSEKLSSDDWNELRKHPEIGARILQSAESFERLTEGVKCHHERWDGKGYPEGRAGNDIPLSSRIVAVCDAFDAMTGERPYKNRIPQKEAEAEILLHAGTQFDPEIAVLFVSKVLKENIAG